MYLTIIFKHPFSETARPINAKFHVEPLCEGGKKVNINGPGQKTKMVAIYGNQRTNGPVNAHLIPWPTKAQNIQNLENI